LPLSLIRGNKLRPDDWKKFAEVIMSKVKLDEILGFPWSPRFFDALGKQSHELKLDHAGLGFDTVAEPGTKSHDQGNHCSSKVRASAGSSLALFAGLLPATAEWLTTLDIR
jgi:hypothetical protein